jgi:hypothetical protein
MRPSYWFFAILAQQYETFSGGEIINECLEAIEDVFFWQKTYHF